MNEKNLRRAIKHIKTIPEDKLDMSRYRYYPISDTKPICKSVGCIIGQCTALDVDNINKYHTKPDGEIDFFSWSAEFFGLYTPCVFEHKRIWEYLFGASQHNIKDYHIYRMEYILKNKRTPLSNYRGQAHHYDDGYFCPKGMVL